MRIFFLLIFLFSFQFVEGQSIQRMPIDFVHGNSTLKFATAGGLNSPQFNEADLNHDGIQDLVVFDRAGDVIRTFINHGTANKMDYTFEPKYIDNFPLNLKNWFLLKDYDKDGAEDIFACSGKNEDRGVIVFKGYYENNALKFRRLDLNQGSSNILYFPISSGNSNLYVSNDDYPDINDIDDDGDLDIVTFSPAGGFVYLYSNKSVEYGFGLDSLIFNLTDYCWGKFYEKGENEYVSLSPNNTDCSKGLVADSIERGSRHVGSTLLTLDMDNDGDKEIILGDISFSSIGMLTNGGTKTNAWMTAQEPFFPTKDVSALVYTFPATFYLDINNDQKKDLIVSPNAINSSDDIYSSWVYLNSGITNKPNFKLNSKNFLIQDMVDFGSGCYPTFGDIDGDGLQDLLIGTEGSYIHNSPIRDIRLIYYKNIGSKNAPKFQLIDSNYLNINEFKTSEIIGVFPALGDIDGDGDIDLILGLNEGSLIFYQNDEGAGKPVKFSKYTPKYFSIDVGNYSKPQIIDVNDDGMSDLIIGEQNGFVNYYKNIGTIGNAKFSKDSSTSTYGKIRINPNPDFPDGFTAPYLVKSKSGNKLFIGSYYGDIYYYEQVTTDSFALKNSYFGNLKEGLNTSIVVNDINNDNKYDFFIGNYRGGLSTFTSDISTSISDFSLIKELDFHIIPNPNSGLVTLQFTDYQPKKINMFDMMGMKILETATESNSIELSLKDNVNGIYFLHVESAEYSGTQKIIIQK